MSAKQASVPVSSPGKTARHGQQKQRGKNGDAGREIKVIAKNRSARHEYFIEETFEAGIVLTGTEVKSLRERNCQITDAFVLVRKGEAWLHGVHLLPYTNGTIWNADPDRKRKLLLHRNQIDYLSAKTSQQGSTIVALQMYFDEHNRVKLQIGLARGKKLYDKRDDMARRDMNREIERALKARNRLNA